MEKGLWDGAYMRILLNGKWHVVLEDGTTGTDGSAGDVG